jgi:hypothetical protein
MINGDIRNLSIKNPQSSSGPASLKKSSEKQEEPKDIVAIQGKSILDDNVIMPPNLNKISINKTLVNFAESLEEKPAEGQEKEWTIMFYMDGANDLEPHMAKAMLDLENVGSNDKINLVSQIARLSQDEVKKVLGEKYKDDPKALEEVKNHKTNIDGDWNGVKRYYIINNQDTPSRHPYYTSRMERDLYLTDISNPQTLADFVSWGIKKYPAKHYMLVVMDHGAGWPGALNNDFSGYNGQMMSTPSIAEALKTAEKTTNKKLDIVHFATCLMGSSEVAYQLKDSADYMIASEEMGTTKALNYGPVIQKINDSLRNGGTSTKDLSRMIVNHFKEHQDAFMTHAAIELSMMEEVKNKIDELAVALHNTATSLNLLKEIIGGVQNYGNLSFEDTYRDYRDLKDFANAIMLDDRIKDEKLKVAAFNVRLAVEQAVVGITPTATYTREETSGVTMEHHGRRKITHVNVIEEQIGGGGMSIYLPIDKKEDYDKLKQDYSQLAIAKNTQWDEFIDKQANTPSMGDNAWTNLIQTLDKGIKSPSGDDGKT